MATSPGATRRGHPSHQSPRSPFFKEYPAWQGCPRLKSPSHRLPEGPAGGHWVLLSQLPHPKHMATFPHLLLTQATAWLLERRGQRLGHVCTGCNPPPQGWHTASHLAAKTRLFRASKAESRGAFPQNNIETEGWICRVSLWVPVPRPRLYYEDSFV